MIHTPIVGVLEAHPAAPSSGWNLEPDLACGRGNSFPLSVSQLFSHLHMLSNSEILFFATFSFKNRKQQPVSTSKRYPFQRIGRDTPASAGFCSFPRISLLTQPMATRWSYRSCSRWPLPHTCSYTSQLVAVILAVQKSQQSRPASGHTNVRKSNELLFCNTDCKSAREAITAV